MPTTVAIVEDNADVSSSLEQMLADSTSCTCVCRCETAEAALMEIPRRRPAVVLMDIELPGLSGIECTARLKRLVPETRILILTVYKDDEQIFRALEAGANGYILKRSASADILRAISDVQDGGAAMSAEIAARVVKHFHKPVSPAGLHSLTRREDEILALLAQGAVSKEIGAKLGISYETVRRHLGNIYDKLHVRSRTEAVIKYLGKP